MKAVLLLLFTIWLRSCLIQAQSYGGAWPNPAVPFPSIWGQHGGAAPQGQWPSPWARPWAGQGASAPPQQPSPAQYPQMASPWGPRAGQWPQPAAPGVPASNPWEQWAKAWPALMGAESYPSRPSSSTSEDHPQSSGDPNVVHGWPYSFASRADPTPPESAINAYNDMYKEMYKMLMGQVAGGTDPMMGARSNSRSLKTEHKPNPSLSAKKQPLLRRSLDGGDARNGGSAASAGSGEKSD